MGSYFLGIKPKGDINYNVFQQREQSLSFEFNNEEIKFKKFKKSLLKIDSFITKNDEGFIVGRGSISYKSLSSHDGFQELSNNLNSEKLEVSEIFGHFSIVHYLSKTNVLNIYFDESGYGAPYVIDYKFISSSFLSCVDNMQELSLNNEAIFEQIYSGCYFNGKTTFNEIRKITKPETWNLDNLTINFIPIIHEHKVENHRTKHEAVANSLKILDDYCQRWALQIKEHKADIGLSSGYDSRLMLSLLEKNYKENYQVHCYWKKKSDFDNLIANQLAKTVNKNLVSIPVRDRDKLSTEEFETLITNAMFYYDGLHPVNHGWLREYRTQEHRSKILKESRFGLSGLSGEQYRNEFNFLNKSHKISYLIKDVLLETSNHEVLNDSHFKNRGIEILKNSVIQGLGLVENSNRISRFDVQRLYCEMWVTGGPGLRNQIENNLTFFISPFTERYIQKKSYDIIKYLGLGGRFQSEMITNMNVELAKVKSDYGFSFNKIPFKHDFKSFISSFVKRKTKLKIASFLRPKSNNYSISFGLHNDVIENKIAYLRQFDFPFPVESSKFQEDTWDRLIALSTLLKYYESKI